MLCGKSRRLSIACTICMLIARIISAIESDSKILAYLESLETNETLNKVAALRVCDNANTVCGFLQANAKGINKQTLCSCPHSSCSMIWDSEDGFSITQGAEQYKFCGKAPILSVCEESQPAYTGRLIYLKQTSERIASMDEMHCICPETHNYVMSQQVWNPAPNVDTKMVEFSYTCAPLPKCNPRDVCKVVSETPTEFLVNKKCRCPNGMSCPTLGNLGLRSYHTADGRMDLLSCQQYK